MWDGIKGLIFDPIIAAFQAMWNFVTGIFKDPVAAFYKLWSDMKAIFTGVIDAFMGMFLSVIRAFNSFFDAIKRLFTDLALALVRVGAEMGAAIVKPIKDAFKSVTNGGKGIFDSIGDAVTGLFKSSGGLVPAYHAAGGIIPQYLATGGDAWKSRGTDTVPAMLTPGEFVVRRNAVDTLGLPALNKINHGMLPGSDETTTNNITMNLSIKTEQPIDENFVKTKIMPALRDELRRSSIDGKRVLAPSGVR
jgi:hypothetical protein